MTEKNEKDSLSRCDHLQIEAYRTQNLWNDHDGKNMMVMDVIVATVAAALLFKGGDVFESTPLKWVVTILLAIMAATWGLFYYKFSKRMIFRYDTMRAIEGKLGFRAHKEVKTFISTHCLQHCLQKLSFLWVRIGLTILLLGFVVFSLWCSSSDNDNVDYRKKAHRKPLFPVRVFQLSNPTGAKTSLSVDNRSCSTVEYRVHRNKRRAVNQWI